MICPHCKTEETVIYRQVNSSGSKVVVERCPNCHRNPNKGKPFLPLQNYNWDELPLFENYSDQSMPCCVAGCANIGTEYHHFAPRHLFDNPDGWPTGYLCKEHHNEWHEKTRTGSYYKRPT